MMSAFWSDKSVRSSAPFSCGHSPEDAVGELPPDDSCFAHDVLLVVGEAVDAGGEHSSHGGGNRFGERPPQFPRPLATVQRSSLEEAAGELLDEEGVAVCAGNDEVAEVLAGSSRSPTAKRAARSSPLHRAPTVPRCAPRGDSMTRSGRLVSMASTGRSAGARSCRNMAMEAASAQCRSSMIRTNGARVARRARMVPNRGEQPLGICLAVGT